MEVTYYGHACFAAQVADRRLLFDPFISANELARAIDVKSVPADFILISHGHMDHLADAAEIARRTGGLIISNYERVPPRPILPLVRTRSTRVPLPPFGKDAFHPRP